MDSAHGRFPQRGGFARIQDEHDLTEFGPRPHRSCNNRLAPFIRKMRTRGTRLDGAVQSSCPISIEPATRASSDRRPEAVERSLASVRQLGLSSASYLGRPTRLGDA